MHYKIRYYDFIHDKEGSFRVSGHDFWCAMNIVESILDESIEEGAYDILLFKAEPTVNGEVQDHDGEDGDIHAVIIDHECPYCHKINKIPEMMTVYRCQHCKKEVKRELDKEQEDNGDGGEE